MPSFQSHGLIRLQETSLTAEVLQYLILEDLPLSFACSTQISSHFDPTRNLYTQDRKQVMFILTLVDGSFLPLPYLIWSSCRSLRATETHKLSLLESQDRKAVQI